MNILKALAITALALTCVGKISADEFAPAAKGGIVVAKAKSKNDGKKGKNNAKDLKIKGKDIEKKSDLRDNVVQYRGGCYIKGIPMIDQGNKPTCAICTVRRLLCYYTDSTPNRCPIPTKSLEGELGYTKGAGTDTNVMVKVLQKHAASLHLSCDRIYVLNMSASALLKEYNQLASKRKGAKELDLSASRGKGIELEDYVKKINYKVWKEMRCDGKTDVQERKRCWKAITDNIDRGIPLCWCVQLGLFKEPKSGTQPVGGHMRLIIGYDAKNGHIIYSDSWGNEHAKKEMPWDDAWAITNQIIVLKPSH